MFDDEKPYISFFADGKVTTHDGMLIGYHSEVIENPTDEPDEDYYINIDEDIAPNFEPLD